MLAWGVDFTTAELRTGVRQTDGFTCGPTVAMVASALLDPSYADVVADYGAEQHRIHAAANRIWPKKLGTTPWGVAATITAHTAELGTRYGWRFFRGRRDRLADVTAAVDTGWPVAMLVGKGVPRHWVLITAHPQETVLRCFEPGSGQVRDATIEEIQQHRIPRLGFPRAYALVLPTG
ncbi:hypothetical protein AB0K00_11580 [Dactylosporangium sp. NPDC049525]|uniref:hypothetical protein n=1 Tax=Dactylosporangium sp. NPDC049525 TaxID=3154730 RepID=UPI00341F33F0